MSKDAVIVPLLQKYYSLGAIAAESWLNDSVLYLPLEEQCLLQGATALASLLFLNELNLKFTIERAKNVYEMSPSGKGPLLKCGKYVVGEYDTIVNFCNLKNLKLLNNSDEDRKAYMSFIETEFSNLMSYVLFNSNENVQSVKDIYTILYPIPLNIYLYYKEYYFTKNKLNLKSIWNLSKDQALNRFSEMISSLNRKFNIHPYLIETRISEVDLLLFSHMKIIYNYKEYNDLKVILKKFENIENFYSNLNSKYAEFIKSNFNNNYDH